MPTLLEKNKIVIESWMSKETKRDIQNNTGIEYIMKWISQRLWIAKDVPPEIPIKTIGSRVLVLRSGTGSGKSTTLPTNLYSTFFEKNHKNIVITQPRKATTTDIPYQIATFYKNLRLGENLGYQTHTLTYKPAKGILFTTVGMLLQFLKSMDDDTFCKKYGFIIVDEVHERSIDLDSILYYIKSLLKRKYKSYDCPFVILTSGTFDPKIYMEYFECPRDHFIDVVGSTYPIEDHFVKFSLSNVFAYIMDLVGDLHIKGLDDGLFRDILIFVSGAYEVRVISNLIHYYNFMIMGMNKQEMLEYSKRAMEKYEIKGGEDGGMYVLPVSAMSEDVAGDSYYKIFSSVDSLTVDIYDFSHIGGLGDVLKIQDIGGSGSSGGSGSGGSGSGGSGGDLKVIKKSQRVFRRAIIGSNAVETGMTIDTLGYCIDMGFVRQSEFNPDIGVKMLLDKPVSKNSAVQRRGRVGRKAPGKFYACYTKEVFDMLPQVQADVVKEEITSFLLSMIIKETGCVLEEYTHEYRSEYDKGVIVLADYMSTAFDRKKYILIAEKPFSVEKLDFIEYPSYSSMSSGFEKLYTLGFIDYNYFPTLFGYYASKIRMLPLESIRMILAGYHTGGCILDLITIACAMQVRGFIDDRKKYRPRNVFATTEATNEFYSRVLLLDEFIEELFIWYEFMDKVGELGSAIEKGWAKGGGSGKILPSQYLVRWADENGLSLDRLMLVVETRDDIISDFLTLGLNPFYNGLGLEEYDLRTIFTHLDEGLDEVCKIKNCIYEGYRSNLIIKKPQGFVNVGDVPVNVESELIKKIGKSVSVNYMISYGMLIKKSKITQKYMISASGICVLDGYVNVDLSFGMR
jgi:hypothetical protein